MGKQKKSSCKHKSHSGNKEKCDKKMKLKNDVMEVPLYKIQESEILGRYLVATKSISAGEVVMTEEPLVVGPCQEAKPLCIGCYVNIDLKNSNTFTRCKFCTWPLCTVNCSGYHQKHGHSEAECNYLTKSKIKEIQVPSFEDFYYAITPFRCLLMKNKNPENWKILSTMEAHTKERKKYIKLWETNEKMAVNIIRNVWGCREFAEDEIHFVCGVLEVNAFEVNSKSPVSQCLRAVYPQAFLFSHDCVPNTCRSNTQNFQLIVRTIRTIPANETITISYAYTLQSTLMRRKHLKQTKFFFCSCKRCSDPTEFGTFTGAMKCLTCNVGFLLPENALDETSLWKCTSQKCKNQIEVAQIIPLLEKLFKELDSIGGNDVVKYETFVKKCCTIFHENHYLCLSALHCLSQLYGKIHGYLINDLTNEQLERKEEICKKLIRIFEKLEPGLSKQRGILLYELHAPLMVLLKRRFQNLTKKEFKSKIKEVIKYLEEAYLILSKEPEYSAENQMADAAKEAIRSLQDWMNLL